MTGDLVIGDGDILELILGLVSKPFDAKLCKACYMRYELKVSSIRLYLFLVIERPLL
jgi:hypothetical protein